MHLTVGIEACEGDGFGAAGHQRPLTRDDDLTLIVHHERRQIGGLHGL